MLGKANVALIAFASALLIGAGPATRLNPASEITYTASLTGLEQVTSAARTAGDPDGAGMVRLTVDPERKRICYDFRLSGLSTPLMAHIHRGPAFRNGPSVVTLFTGPGGDLDDCLDWTRERLAEIVSDPTNFYVNLATTEFPDGALRGQLQG